MEAHVAGAEGFEPSHGGTKNRCLTAWRRPNSFRGKRRHATLTDPARSSGKSRFCGKMPKKNWRYFPKAYMVG